MRWGKVKKRDDGQRPSGLSADLQSCQLKGEMAININNHYSRTSLHMEVMFGEEAHNPRPWCVKPWYWLQSYNSFFFKWRKMIMSGLELDTDLEGRDSNSNHNAIIMLFWHTWIVCHLVDSNPRPQVHNAHTLNTTLLCQLLIMHY